MPNIPTTAKCSDDQLIAIAASGRILDCRLYKKLHQFKTHWLLSPEGAVALADTVGTTSLAGGIATAATGLILVRAISQASDNDFDGNMENYLDEFLVQCASRSINWAWQRTTTILNEAQQNVIDRIQTANHVTFSTKHSGANSMSPTEAISFTTAGNVRSLNDDVEPVCPITKEIIPLNQRAIVIHCTDEGNPAATIYNQAALLKWLEIKNFDPMTRKTVECVINSKGSIIYPVRIQSELSPGNSNQVAGTTVLRRILPTGRPTMTQNEIKARRAYRKAHGEEIMKRIRVGPKNY